MTEYTPNKLRQHAQTILQLRSFLDVPVQDLEGSTQVADDIAEALSYSAYKIEALQLDLDHASLRPTSREVVIEQRIDNLLKERPPQCSECKQTGKYVCFKCGADIILS